MQLIEYCFRAVIQYLDGDFKRFKKYRDKAIEAYEKEQYIATIEDLIPDRTRRQLYRMIN